MLSHWFDCLCRHTTRGFTGNVVADQNRREIEGQSFQQVLVSKVRYVCSPHCVTSLSILPERRSFLPQRLDAPARGRSFFDALAYRLNRFSIFQNRCATFRFLQLIHFVDRTDGPSFGRVVASDENDCASTMTRLAPRLMLRGRIIGRQSRLRYNKVSCFLRAALARDSYWAKRRQFC